MPFWAPGLPTIVDEVYGDHPMEPRPATFRWKNMVFEVQHITAYWRIHTKWWTGDDAWRDYWQVATPNGVLAWIYYDKHKHKWFLERVYE